MSEEPITLWLERLEGADARAAEVIWSAYFEKLVRLADKRLKGLPRRSADEEDVALSAMKSFFTGARAGRFPRLEDRDDLWKLLVTITARKAIAEQRRHFAARRGGGRVHGDSAFGADGESGSSGIEHVLGNEPTPEMAAIFAETCGRLIDQLDEPSLRKVADLRLAGHTTDEIAEKLNCTRRTVARKLARIRGIWSRDET